MADLTFQRMADVILAFQEELERRNPIGVNLYTPYLVAARKALIEIHEGERHNPTCDNAGSFRENDPHSICALIPMQNACTKCIGIEYRHRLDALKAFSVAPGGNAARRKR